MIARSKPISRKRRKPRKGACVDRKYIEWLHAQGSVVRTVEGFMACGGGCADEATLAHAAMLAPWRIEVHHIDRPRNDHRAVPLYWWLHRETAVSVHGGGGRRAFERRFGINLEIEANRLYQKYLEEKANDRTAIQT